MNASPASKRADGPAKRQAAVGAWRRSGFERRPRLAQRSLADEPVLDAALGEVAGAGAGDEFFDPLFRLCERRAGPGGVAGAVVGHREVEVGGGGAVGEFGDEAAGEPVDGAFRAIVAVLGDALQQAEPVLVALLLAADGPDLVGDLVEACGI